MRKPTLVTTASFWSTIQKHLGLLDVTALPQDQPVRFCAKRVIPFKVKSKPTALVVAENVRGRTDLSVFETIRILAILTLCEFCLTVVL